MPAVDLHHRLDGSEDAAPLLLGGSLGTRLQMWEPQVGPLSERLRLIRFDHRGHGGSPVPEGPYAIEDLGRDVLALMDRLELERASYGGLSIGGMTGMWLAANAPERIDRLVLICTAAHFPDASVFVDRAAAAREAGSVEGIADAVVERWLTPAYAQAHPEVRGWLRDMVAETPAEGYAACCDAIAGMDLRESLPQISAPTLVISGSQDPSTPPELQRVIAQAVPDSRLETVEAAHLGSVERADEVSALVLGHVDR